MVELNGNVRHVAEFLCQVRKLKEVFPGSPIYVMSILAFDLDPEVRGKQFDLCRLATWTFEIGDHLLMLLWQLSFLSSMFVGLPWAKSWLGHDQI